MNQLIGTAILIATLFGGTITAEKIFLYVRKEALMKAAIGLPNLSSFSRSLTRSKEPEKKRSKNIKKTHNLLRVWVI